MTKNFTIVFLFVAILSSCGQKRKDVAPTTQNLEKEFALSPIDTTKIDAFFVNSPLFAKYRKEKYFYE